MKYLNLTILILFIISLSLLIPANAFNGTQEVFPVASGVVPHHLLAKGIIEDFFSHLAEQEVYPDTIILLSPDHFNSSMLNQVTFFITVNWETGNKKILEIPLDVSLLKKLSTNHSVKQNNGAILSEFGITHLLPFIKKFLPETKIIPIIIPEDMSREQVESLVHDIHKISSSSTVIIASVDFSHYLPVGAADFHDTKSQRVLLNFEEREFEHHAF